MRIMHIDVNYNFSSTGKIVNDLILGFNDRGHSVLAIYGRGEVVKSKFAHKIASNSGVLFHALATRLTGLTDGFSPFSTKRLFDYIESFKPDVVNLHDLHGYFININDLVNFLILKKIPTVWTFHCEFMYTGKCGYAFDCDKWKTECDDCPKLDDYPKSLFFDFTNRMFLNKKNMFKNFDLLHLISPSEWLANRIRQSFVKDKKLSVIHNGIDTSIFSMRTASSLKSELNIGNEFVVLSVGSDLLSDRKGGKWVLELARRNLNRSYVFVMVGVDKIPNNLPVNVRLISPIADQSLLAEYYSFADVLLLTSEKETFSMVCAESLACGTPVIGFDSGAPKEVALPGYGEFVQYGNLDELEFLLHSVHEARVKFRSPIECVEFARARYSKASMINSYLAVYESMIK